MRPFSESLVAAGAIALSLCGAAATARADAVFSLRSPAFADNGVLASKFAGNEKSNPNCIGDNVSPPLAWSNPPDGTRSFALVVTDPEGRGGLGVVHWVAYGIAPSVTGFAEGEVSRPSDKFIGGKSTLGRATYFGPCPTPGDWHHYTFTLIATDLDPKALQPGLTRDELFAALAGHTKRATGLIGRFRHR